MNIMYCGDINIQKGMLISIMSLVKTSKEPINFYVLTINLKKEDANGKECISIEDSFIQYISNYIKSYNSENTIQKFDVSDAFLKEIPLININTRFTPCCMLRLFSDLVPEIPEKVLYLDNDVICRRDISDFYNTDISEYEIGGVLDYYGSHFYKNYPIKKDYLNSGVLLLNMKRIRQEGSFQKCRDMCRTKSMFLPDQAALNKVCRNKMIFSHLYNDQRRLHNDTFLQHFTTTFRMLPKFTAVTVKPWDIDKVHDVLHIYEYDNLFGEYTRNLNYYLDSKNS